MNKTIQIAASTFAAATLIALAGCGVETRTGSNGTGISPPSEPTVASGPLTGLGPLGVAGASLDDKTTQVLLNISASRGAGDLRLGMTANANGTADSKGSGQAYGAVVQSFVRGPATGVDAVARQLTVLTMTVRVDQNTLLQGVNSLGDIVVGDEVEVFGMPLPRNQGQLATRIIVRRPPVSAYVELLGQISEVGTASLVVQGISVNIANAQIGTTAPGGVVFSPPADPNLLSPGVLIRVIGHYDPATRTLTAATVAARLAPSRPEGNLVFIEGFVQELTGAIDGRHFNLPDIEVDASAVPSVAGNISAGTRVRLRGRMHSAILIADAIDIIDPAAQIEFVVDGEVAAFSSIASFEVRGEAIDATQALFTGGNASNLANGRRVRVKGIAGPGRITASEVLYVN
jgi:Domain of unknown function (DUF5666)